MKTAREAAATALLSVFSDGGYSNIVLDNILEKEDLSREDRSFCAALFYGVAERLLTLDAAIAAYCKTPPAKLSPAVLTALRCGFYQLLYMPSVPPSAAVNETVTLTKTLGEERGAGLVNGVLRSFLRADLTYPLPKDKLTALSVQYSVPMPLIQLWRKSYGHEAAIKILEGLCTLPPIFVRVNTTRTTTEKLIEALAAEGVTALPCESSPHALRLSGTGSIARLTAFRMGLFHVQDLSSQLCAAAGAPTAGMRVLDVCSAPGGKAFTMGELMENRGELVACDLYPARLALVTEGAARLGLGIIKAQVGDGGVKNPKLGLFDLVLCDAPCSGFGIIRRKPEIRYKAVETLDELPSLQYNILHTSSCYCKAGGSLVYSTCTLNPRENEQVVERFLGEHPDFCLAAPPRTIFPNEQEGADGFFYALLKQK
ncbi:MAG: 16S rRNA (cytosine(967)-C(5))-methyltransferase RsmB [Angelakisella sp.]